MKSKNSIVLFKNKKITRNIFINPIKRVGRKILMLLRVDRYIQVGLHYKKKTKISNYLLYKTLYSFIYNKYQHKNYDYLYSIKDKKKREDYCLILKNRKSSSFFDLFYFNKNLNWQKSVPILLNKFQYKLQNKKYNILSFLNNFNIKHYNLLYLQYYNEKSFNYIYFLDFYKNLKYNIFSSLNKVLLNYNEFLNLSNIFSIINNNINYNFQFMFLDNYIKINNVLNVKTLKVLDKYLLKNKMFRAGKFFYNFLEYMKHFTFNVYKNNMFYRKLQYTKFNSNKYKCNFKLITINSDKLYRLKGWFHVYNYIKKLTYLSYNENNSKNNLIFHYIKKYNYFYCFIIKFFFKLLYNLKSMFIEKINFKKIQFLKLVIFYSFYNKWFKFKNFIKKLKKGKIKKRNVRRILRFFDLKYVKFLLRIKSRILVSNYLLKLKLGNLIRKRKRLNFYKFKNSIRVVNWLLKYRKLKGIKNPFIKVFRKHRKISNYKDMKVNSKLNQFKNKLQQLSRPSLVKQKVFKNYKNLNVK